MGVHLGKDYYVDNGSRYRPRHLSYRMVHNVTDFLVDADCLEMPSGMGTWHPDQFTTTHDPVPGHSQAD